MTRRHYFLYSTLFLLLSCCAVEGQQPHLKLVNCQPNANPTSQGKTCDVEKGPVEELSSQTDLMVEFEDGTLVVYHERTIPGKGWNWQAGNGHSFNLVTVDTQYFGVFDHGGIVYNLKQDSDGEYHVKSTPQIEFPPEGDGHEEKETQVMVEQNDNVIFIRNLAPAQKNVQNLNSLEGVHQKGQQHQVRGLRGDDSHRRLTVDTVLDVLIVWTRRAECEESFGTASCTLTAASQNDVLGRLGVAIAEANTAYANSGIPVELRLVHAYRDDDYVEDASNPDGVGLDHLSNENDGFLDGVHNKRNSFGADIVALIYYRDGRNICGRASVGNPTPQADRMFSVTSIDCINFDTFSHELGHNFGCYHERESSSTLVDFAHGYRNAGLGFRSIMATSCANNACPRQKFFSNDDMAFDNKVNGAANADCVRQHNENRAVVNAFRDTKPTCNVHADCADGNATTFDVCVEGFCSNPLCLTDAQCDDGDANTLIDFCDCGACRNYECATNDQCADAYDCTTDTCNLPGICQHVWTCTDPLIGPEKSIQPSFTTSVQRENNGVYLQIEPTVDILVTQFDIHTSSTSSIDVRVLYIAGDRYDLFPSDSSWIDHETVTVTGQGLGTLTPVPLTTPLFVDQRYTFQIISYDDDGMQASSGSGSMGSVSNSEVTVFSGYSVRYTGSGGASYSFFRFWEGTIRYHCASDQVSDSTDSPSMAPSAIPSRLPSRTPSTSLEPSGVPSRVPSTGPSQSPSLSSRPSSSPSSTPSLTPSTSPSLSAKPSSSPSNTPTREASASPSVSLAPSRMPSSTPSWTPSTSPSVSAKPSLSPSNMPTREGSAPPSASLAPSSMPSSTPSWTPSTSPSVSAKPSSSPSNMPTREGSAPPSASLAPSSMPSSTPSSAPSTSPSVSAKPSLSPSYTPTREGSAPPSASLAPSKIPSLSSSPSSSPSSTPSSAPSTSPSVSAKPSSSPSNSPTREGSASPSASLVPSSMPSITPSSAPSTSPSVSAKPSSSPSNMPTREGSASPSASLAPSSMPSSAPSSAPSTSPSLSAKPSSSPSNTPTREGSASPSASLAPSSMPSSAPSSAPSTSPSVSAKPSSGPSNMPTREGSAPPSASLVPSGIPSVSMTPSTTPSAKPSESPTDRPSIQPSLEPSSSPSQVPSSSPSKLPSISMMPSNQPSAESSATPSSDPSASPSGMPSSNPSQSPSVPPSLSSAPSTVPSLRPSTFPSEAPTSGPTSSLSCTNDLNWSFETKSGKKTRDCDWVGDKDVEKRCLELGTNGEGEIVPATEACPEFCVDACQPIAGPSPSPSMSPTMGCVNNPDWSFLTKSGKKTRDCDWVGDKEGEERAERCLEVGTIGGDDDIVPATEACPEFCLDRCQPIKFPTSSPSDMPSMSPSVSSAPTVTTSPTTGCMNNPGWSFLTKSGKKTRDCDWVGDKEGEERAERCLEEGTIDGDDAIVAATEACPEFCLDRCQPITFPTSSPSDTPSLSPTPGCENDPDWFFYTKSGKKTRDCQWVGDKDTESRCENASEEGVSAVIGCPEFCNESCQLPPADEDPGDGDCVDDASWFFYTKSGKKILDCEWVADNDTNERCEEFDHTGEVSAYEACCVCHGDNPGAGNVTI